ncbi:MAG TPA: VWA domain-containing protein, partial [Armatimonadetes bacterium]|nr:VWA domain-containing protein [Armatimonadota bacterium]
MPMVMLNHRLSYQAIPASSSMRLVHLLVDVDASATSPIVAPMVLGVVVDRSESMSLPMITAEQLEELRRSGKVRPVERDGVQVWEFRGLFPPAALRDAPRALDFVKRALRSVVEHLRDEDQFALTAFASKATTVLPLQSGRMRAEMIRALEQLEKLRLGDETLMASGLQLAYEQLQPTLDESMLHRMIVLTDGYVQDEELCRQWGARIAEAGVIITTIGIGASFNEDLMM